MRAGRASAPGFTLIEVLVAAVVAAVLLGLAAPQMARWLAARAVTEQAEDFMSALRLARSEAVARGEVVTVCARDPAAPGPSCRPPGAADWRAGWIVFVDRGPRGLLDSGDAVLRTHEALPASGGASGTRASLSFLPGGIGLDAAAHVEFLPSGGAPDASRLVCISKQGKPRLGAIGPGRCG